jgi:prepilin-type N-terminal cleavage/methylation domain-containing protein/prepilin-type processing-associated H-X9-DG protein
MNRKGFTLIELLVVIAIIAILSAILFPVFASAREKARQMSCISNEKQLGIAFSQYTQDFDERYPVGINGSAGLGWGHEIYPYVKSSQVFTCPDDTTQPSPDGHAISYGYNRNLANSSWINNFEYTNNMAALTSPSRTVCLFEVVGYTSSVDGSTGTDWSPAACGPDGGGDGGMNGPTNGSAHYATGFMGTPSRTSGSDNNTYGPLAPPRHTQGSDFLFCDSHVVYSIGTLISSGPSAYTSTSVQNGSQAAGTADTTVLWKGTFSGV